MAASVSSRVLRVRRMVAIALLVATAWSTVTPLVSSARAQTAPAAAGDAVRPFSIRVPEATLVDLKARLAKARLPEPLAGPGWDLGTDVAYLRQLLDYWRDRFDWRAQERLLNRMEQFTTTIDGLSIHFVHRRSPHAGALPLLVTHGWPGSIAEFTKVIGPLTDPPAHGGRADDAFHVVMPSIPGFGFSTAPRAAGMDPARIAAIEAALMARLGYTRYGVQGGDWGAIIGTQVAARHPAQVAGLHLNMCSAPAPAADPNAGLTDAELARLKVRQVFQAEETGYQQIQGTKPQTIGIALTDSPVGLAAWIVEKFRTWCDCEGNPEAVFTKDELLTNITLYWATQSAASSARIYYESRHPTSAPVPGRIEVPTACADFPKEIIWSPRRWAEARYNITRWTMMPKGGHFAALEQPHALVDDVRAFFRDLRPR
jgi:pimeloyl-ACP methyl ester carboxylesterase